MTEAEVNQLIRQLSEYHGEAFDRETAQELGELIDDGYDALEAYDTVFEDADYEDAATVTYDDEPASYEDEFLSRFEETVHQLEQDRGHELTEGELQKLYNGAAYEGNPRHVAKEALHDTATKRGRVNYIDQRLAELDPKETPDTVAPLTADHTKAERVAFINARMDGAEVDPDAADPNNNNNNNNDTSNEE